MAVPVTTTELLLAQVVDLLTEVRDLLQSTGSAKPAPRAAKRATAKKAAPAASKS